MKIPLKGPEGMRALAGATGLAQKSCEGCGALLEAYSNKPDSWWSCKIEGCTMADFAETKEKMS